MMKGCCPTTAATLQNRHITKLPNRMEFLYCWFCGIQSTEGFIFLDSAEQYWHFMPVKWHFSEVHTGPFFPIPVFYKSIWTWLYKKGADTAGQRRCDQITPCNFSVKVSWDFLLDACMVWVRIVVFLLVYTVFRIQRTGGDTICPAPTVVHTVSAFSSCFSDSFHELQKKDVLNYVKIWHFLQLRATPFKQ